MSTEAITWALSVHGLSPRAKLVLIGLADSADKASWACFPSRKSLAEIGDCSVDTVDRAMKEIIAAGHLKVTGRTRNGGGQSSNLYTLTPSRNYAAPPENHPDRGRKVAEGGAEELRPPPPAEMPRGEPHSYAAGGAASGAAPYEPPLNHVVVSAPVPKERIDALVDRLGAKANVAAGELRHGAVLNRLLRGGCDWAEDIEPAADALAASWTRRDGINSWKLIEERALRLRDIRLSGVAPPQPVSEQPRRAGKADAGAVIDRVFGVAS